LAKREKTPYQFGFSLSLSLSLSSLSLCCIASHCSIVVVARTRIATICLPACLLVSLLAFSLSKQVGFVGLDLSYFEKNKKIKTSEQLCSEEIFEFFIERSQEPCKHGDLGSFREVHVNLKSCFVTMRTPWRIVEQDISIQQVTANLLHPLFWLK
jgi:hypothetical protein